MDRKDILVKALRNKTTAGLCQEEKVKSEGRVKAPQRQQSMMGRLCAAVFPLFSSSYSGRISHFTYCIQEKKSFKKIIITSNEFLCILHLNYYACDVF